MVTVLGSHHAIQDPPKSDAKVESKELYVYWENPCEG